MNTIIKSALACLLICVKFVGAISFAADNRELPIEYSARIDDIKLLGEEVGKHQDDPDISFMLGRALKKAAEHNKPEIVRIILNHVSHNLAYLYTKGYLLPGRCPILLFENDVYDALQLAQNNNSNDVLDLFASIDGKLMVRPECTSYFTWKTMSLNMKGSK
jgi:hypothetical protein